MTYSKAKLCSCFAAPRRGLAAALLLAFAAAALLALTAGHAQAATRARITVAPTQEVATLHANHNIYSAPGGRWEASISRVRPITESEATTLPVLGTRTVGGQTWLLVRLPGRLLRGAINGRTGWIKATATREWEISWHIVISLSQRTAYIYNHGRLVHKWLVVVGKPSTPTPTGQFFVEENIQEPSDFAGAPYALATSARSNVFTEFDGGPGQIALHGVGGGLGGTPGQAQSHGCVRFTNADISWLAARIWPGTPVTIIG